MKVELSASELMIIANVLPTYRPVGEEDRRTAGNLYHRVIQAGFSTVKESTCAPVCAPPTHGNIEDYKPEDIGRFITTYQITANLYLDCHIDGICLYDYSNLDIRNIIDLDMNAISAFVRLLKDNHYLKEE